jgi:hypothetical protein
MFGGLIDTFGVFGLLLGLLAHLAYQVYRDRLGAVAGIRDAVREAHERLDGVGVILYRKAKEDWEDIDEQELRNLLFNGHEVTFPSDFDEEAYIPEEQREEYRKWKEQQKAERGKP